jgi:hypothetical protein
MTKHREFAMASGEMTADEFTHFLNETLGLAGSHATGGAIIYACMDWRHMGEMLAAGRAGGFDLLNLCVWVKSNGGMGSLYRSRHELVFVFRNGTERHLNNVQLGRFGRNRTNVWNYAGANSFPRKSQKHPLDLHPTVKPIAMVSDAILDSTKRDDIVLDPYLGSGTTILAAERTGRRGYDYRRVFDLAIRDGTASAGFGHDYAAAFEGGAAVITCLPPISGGQTSHARRSQSALSRSQVCARG